ncbi:hypothetical protein Tco_0027102 [Tanacetum coccineum]
MGNRRVMETNLWLRVEGVSNVYVLGDCATIYQCRVMISTQHGNYLAKCFNGMKRCQHRPEGQLRFRDTKGHRFKPFRYMQLGQFQWLWYSVYARLQAFNLDPLGGFRGAIELRPDCGVICMCSDLGWNDFLQTWFCFLLMHMHLQEAKTRHEIVFEELFVHGKLKHIYKYLQTGKKKLCKADLEGPAFNLVKAFHKNNVFLQYQMDECHKLADRKGSGLSSDRLKVNANMTSVRPMASLTGGLGERNSTSTNTVTLDREEHIILRRADYQEYKISEKDFKNLHPNDFEDLFLLNIQEKLNHLPKTDKTSLHTAGILGSGQRMTKEEATDFIHCTQEKHRSEDFLQSLENFVGRRIRDIDYS